MGQEWEQQLSRWASPPSDTERAKCENAERAIREAIKKSSVLSGRNITVHTQGSYRNRTNVRAESDVDICVICTDTYFYNLDMGDGLTRENLGIEPATYSYAAYRAEIISALIDAFGKSAVTPGNKAINIHENSYRVDADVVPCFPLKRYHGKPGYSYAVDGVAFMPQQGARIDNFPDQHYANGVRKHERTKQRFKKVVRVLKNLRQRLPGFLDTPSFLIECLVWNANDYCFGASTLDEDLKSVLANIAVGLRNSADLTKWVEVSDLKYLFHPSKSWTKEQALDFVNAAWKYAGY